MEEYKYTLQYQYNNTIITHKFSAELDVYELIDHLRDFLCACSWSEEQVNDILKLENREG